MSDTSKAINQFSQALSKLDLVLAQPKDEFIRDSAIQRFEFTLDLAWKSLKAYLKDLHGLDCNSPKSAFREAFSVGLLKYDEFWLTLVDKRNETVHTYNESLAEDVYKILPEAVVKFTELLQMLTSPQK